MTLNFEHCSYVKKTQIELQPEYKMENNVDKSNANI